MGLNDADTVNVSAPASRTDRVQELATQWMSKVFVNKNTDYGNSYILCVRTLRLWFPEGVALDTELKTAYYQLLVRMLDKLIRASNLVLCNLRNRVKDEKAYETMADNAVYSFMTAEVLKYGLGDD